MSTFRRYGRLTIAGFTATSVVFTGVIAQAQEAPAEPISISITNFTDFHGHLSDGARSLKEGKEPDANTEMGAAYLAGLMEAVAADNDLALRTTSGDDVGGSVFVSSIQKDEPTLKALNAMDIDAAAAGNHEFDAGAADLTGRIAPALDHPVLSANVIKEDGSTLLEKSHIVSEQGVDIAFVGTTTDKTPQKVSPAGIAGLTFTDPVAAANEEAKRLKESGEADIVVVLQHEDIVTHSAFNEYVDAAFGGDSHLRHLNDNLAQGHEYGKVLSELELTFNPSTGEVLDSQIEQYDYTSLASLNVTPNAEVASIVADAEAFAEEKGKEVLTTTQEGYFRGSNPGERSGSNRGTESTLNNLLAEAARWAMDEQMGEGTIDVGIMNAGGVRADMPAGAVTYADAATIQPFGNNLAYATLSGQALIDALENQWKDPSEERQRLSMGVSNNVSYSYDPTKPQGQRIGQVMINGEPLDPAADYTVAASSFLFEGGDGFIDEADVRNYSDVGVLDLSAFANYLQAEGKPEGRNGQAEIGIAGNENVVAGKPVTLQLSSLNYSSEGEPKANTVTVKAGDVTETAAIDNAVTDADAGLGEQGRAEVTLTVPEGAEEFVITTDAGTEIVVPINSTADGAETDVPGDVPGTDAPTANGSSVAGFIVPAIIAAVLGVAAAVGLSGIANGEVFATIQKMIQDFMGQF
ncbi:bifunctional metallophosphatase/5'-nucleotidase [Corynebacterium tapiri]|uniref:Bifunctional metallophosphatase/5'-nucleotidase n=1 Tax=Corynebacterium tapiri TaxID=1448266 RepID=A0A5C4U3P2_9CORY|nr:bifunctional UDP-sugar hydrolase/5'-nucleotidase [Corynebacterium tapiri]TNL97752.1 bifunctional metallophosphatase/5'-nucleotidase [Corynebacterium tapiri]